MMRRKVHVIVGILMTLAGVAGAQTAPQNTQDQTNPVQQRQRRPAEVLDGRSLAVRVYPDPESDPDRFVLLNVPISNLTIQSSAIKAAYPSITESACVLVQAADQSDEEIAIALDRDVNLYRYTPDSRHRLLLLSNSMPQAAPFWTFFDALGNPMAGAHVEVWLQTAGRSATGVSIRLDGGTLDEEGRLARYYAFPQTATLRLEHPDYGVATIRALSSKAELAGICVAPLMPLNVDAPANSITGTVVDSTGRAVVGVPVRLGPNHGANDSNDCYRQSFQSRVFTDEQGRFTLCVPKLSADMLLDGLSDLGTSCILTIEPPTSSNLRHLQCAANVGAPNTLTLTRMESEQTFHTFSFEYHDGPVTDRNELADMVLTLERDGRQWCMLTFEEFREGCYLPPGILSARTIRWGQPFEFPSIEMTGASPEHLAFKSRPPIVYYGKVVEAGTNRPLPGVYVLADYTLTNFDRDELPAELMEKLAAQQWERLAAAAKAEVTSEATLFQQHDRATVTDADGVYSMVLIPTGGTSRFREASLNGFTAVAEGYDTPAVVHPRSGQNDEIAEVPTIELWPAGTAYFPVFVFEDENGPVTDPDRLAQIYLNISRDNWSVSTTVGQFQKDDKFIAGQYSTEVTWDDKLYVFDSVDLTTARPEVVVFKPISVEPLNSEAEVTYRGLVVDETTGEPISGAVALCCGTPRPPGINGLRPSEWAAIEALGPNPDPSNPAFAPFRTASRPALASLRTASSVGRQSSPPTIAVTGDDGWFELTTKHSPSEWVWRLYVLAQNHLAGFETLANYSGIRGSEGLRSAWTVNYQPDGNGTTVLPTFSLTRAATVIIHPVVPDPGTMSPVREPILRWNAPPDEPAAEWANSFPGHREGIPLVPNVEQIALVPIDVTLRLRMETTPTAGFVNISLGRIRLRQGQVRDLGRVEFSSGVEIVVSVTDGSGQPVNGARVSCMDEEMWTSFSHGTTDEYGVAVVKSPSNTSGYIRAHVAGSATGQRISGTVPYRIGGEEDAGQESVVRLTDVVARP